MLTVPAVLGPSLVANGLSINESVHSGITALLTLNPFPQTSNAV
jgi:hypothetical protein